MATKLQKRNNEFHFGGKRLCTNANDVNGNAQNAVVLVRNGFRVSMMETMVTKVKPISVE